MKKELALHFETTIIFFLLISLYHQYFNIAFLPFWIGGIIGTILPDIDHIIYVYYLRPNELTSQRVMYDVKNGNLWKSIDLIAATRSERKDLIFHTVLFQVLFTILSFLVISSSSSLPGRGLVLAFLLHLFVDEMLDLRINGNLLNWFKNIPFELDKLQLNIYLIANAAIILIFAFVM